jgi:hypothetical protein
LPVDVVHDGLGEITTRPLESIATGNPLESRMQI